MVSRRTDFLSSRTKACLSHYLDWESMDKENKKPEPRTTEEFLALREKARKVQTLEKFFQKKTEKERERFSKGEAKSNKPPAKRKGAPTKKKVSTRKREPNNTKRGEVAIKEGEKSNPTRTNSLPTLTQCFSRAETKKSQTNPNTEKRMVWKTGFPYMCHEVEEFDPNKNYGLYKVRYREKAHPGECYPGNFTTCKKCKHDHCGLCRIEEIADMLVAQQEEADKRWNYVADQTESLTGGAAIDPDWMREQDPVWGSLTDNNRAMEEDLEKYFSDIQAKVTRVKQSIGWI